MDRARILRRTLFAALLLVPCATATAQTGTIAGTVTDVEFGDPLPGVNVVIVGTTQGSSTDIDGQFEIAGLEPDTYTIRASYVGYTPQDTTLTVEAGETTNVSLALAAGIALEEVVVVGYGEQRRRDLTGSVASVSGESVAELASPSVEQAIQGKVAGVQVTPASGEPGQGAVIRIRGVGTLGNASPLYVVDGMLMDDISFLNSNDIQSIEVLKDASATAIYGSRGANGVVIVTTKTGDAGQEPLFTFNAYAGTQNVQHPINLVGAQQYAMLANELAANQGSAAYFENPSAVGAGTDWQDQIFETAPIQSYQLSASGGAERMTYYLSANLISQAGVVPKSDYNRLTLRLNNDYQLTDHVQFGHNINFSYTYGDQAPNVLSALYRADPTVAPRNEDGDFSNANVRSSAGNPAASVFYTRNTENGGRLAGNAFVEADFLQNFTLRSSFGLDLDRTGLRVFTPEFLVSPTQQNETSDLRIQSGNTSSWLWENTLNYNYVSGRHRVSALAGVTSQAFYTEELGGERTNLTGSTENLWYLNVGDEEGQTNFNSASDWRILSFLFRTNYTLLDRYLFTGSLRVDGSSRFSESNRYGYFPSVAVGWNLAEEDFLQEVEVISALKLRASWGQIGNDKIGEYPGIPVVTGNLNAIFGPEGALNFGATPIELANPDVKWERTIQTNVGADLSFFDDALQATFDYYRRLTDGILVRVPIPSYVGVSTAPFVNAASVLNSGLEGSVSWSGMVGSVGLEVGVNGSTVNNDVRELGGGQEEILGGGLGNEITFTTRTVVGRPIGSFWGYEIEGVFQTQEEVENSPTRGGEAPGDLRYADRNGDGIITEDDKTFLGSPIPDVIYGFNFRVNWRGFDLSSTFSGQAGNELFNGKKAVRFGVENFEESFLNRWTGPGTSNSEPRITNAGHNYQASERFIENGSFLKLQTATLGYRLPSRLTGPLNVQGARIYVSGTNLFTLTGYSGYTPEVVSTSVIASGIDLGVYPTSRTITAGVNLTF
ncbi:MAG: SusC/RagA family TonB-linked outer membrane protein [Rhodothermales bacterium]